MMARAEHVTDHHELKLYRTLAIISCKPQPLRTNIEHIIHIQQLLTDLSTLTTRVLIPHFQALHSSHPPPHTSAHQRAPPQVDSKHPQASCAHKGSKEHHTSLQMQACSQHQSTISTTTNSNAESAPNIFAPQVRILSTLNTRAMRNIFELKHNHTYRQEEYRQHLACHKKLRKYRS